MIAAGFSLRSICLRDDMPAQATVFNWLIRHKEFVEQYTRARDLQADRLFDECLEIADQAAGDIVEAKNDDGSTFERIDHENIQRSKLRVDTRKWMAGKLAPKKYGERVAHEISDPEGKPLAPTIILTGRPEPASASEAVGGVPDGGHRGAIRRRSRGR